MNNLEMAGILQTYAEKCRKARDKKHLKQIVLELKTELNSGAVQKLRMSGEEE